MSPIYIYRFLDLTFAFELIISLSVSTLYEIIQLWTTCI